MTQKPKNKYTISDVIEISFGIIAPILVIIGIPFIISFALGLASESEGDSKTQNSPSSLSEITTTRQECINAGKERTVEIGDSGRTSTYYCQEDGSTKLIEHPEYDEGYEDYKAGRVDCQIKGNISYSSGEKIYHVPGQEYYSQTVINTDYGEQWFCSEQEAVNAGWRKSAL